MSFSTHTFEVNPDGVSKSFSFHENVGEGQDLYFIGRFPDGTTDAQSISESLFGEMVDAFKKADQTKDSYDTFEDALKATNLEAAKNSVRMAGTPDIVIAYFDFHNLYLTQSGNSEAYLLRGDNVSQISEPSDDTSDLFNNILSGQVSIDDTVIFSSSRVLRSVTASQLTETFSRSDFDEACAIFRHELTNNAEEDLLVNIIGIGKKSKSGASGFLSKMVSKVTGDEPKLESSEHPPTVGQIEDTYEETPEKLEESETELWDKNFENESTFKEETTEEDLSQTNDSSQDMIGDTMKKIRGFFYQIPAKQRKNGIKAILGILVLVFVGRFLANFESQNTKELRAELQIAREAIQQADTFLLQGDRDQAAEMLARAQNSAQKVLNAQSKDFRFDAQTILADVQDKQLSVENAKKVEPQLLSDISVKNDNVSALGLLELKGGLYAYDTNSFYKTIRNIVEKGVQISTKETILTATTRDDQNTLLFLTDTPRVVESKNGVITPMSTTDESWKKGVDIKTFGRFAYVLDPLENQIWKYERKRAGYSAATAYNQGTDLSRALSMAIDGSIYILSDDGTIQKLFRGVKADFSFRELPSIPFSGKKLRLYTTPNLDFIYVLDPDNTRILVFTKGDRFATYKKQIIFENISDVRDFVIDSTGQKASIITDSKIYELSL